MKNWSRVSNFRKEFRAFIVENYNKKVKEIAQCEKLNYKRLKSFNKRNKEKLELAAALNAQRRAESGELTEEGGADMKEDYGTKIGALMFVPEHRLVLGSSELVTVKAKVFMIPGGFWVRMAETRYDGSSTGRHAHILKLLHPTVTLLAESKDPNLDCDTRYRLAEGLRFLEIFKLTDVL
ncbi:unnamed protein product [Haemonchus placei]|uniref:60S ribosomal protein L7a n=1 Tax=Haemonchus placei TaxID=6290 RepID=A0A0N4WP80_HAEPC|nr:unnamed protein product [Haemonchus placei]